MLKTSIAAVPEEIWETPGGRFRQRSRAVSIALGCDPRSNDASRRHPFDFEHCTIPPRSAACPYHAHSAQWEMYVVLAGEGVVRDEAGRHPLVPGDVVLFPPNEAHQILNESDADLVMLIIADNPLGESCHYPDSGKWLVNTGSKREVIKGHVVDYLDGEEPLPSEDTPQPANPA
jgi:uncharacterized cupin superfamily protein